MWAMACLFTDLPSPFNLCIPCISMVSFLPEILYTMFCRFVHLRMTCSLVNKSICSCVAMALMPSQLLETMSFDCSHDMVHYLKLQ